MSAPAVPAASVHHLPGEAGYRHLMGGLFVAGVATFAALYSTQPLIGVLAERFRVSEGHAAWTVSLATLFVGLGMIVAGPLSDRWGRTRTIKSALFATALLGVACALAPSWPVLLVARALQGLTLAGTPAVALVYLREEVDPGVHPRATGLYIGGTAIGGLSGRLVVGGVADLFGWRWGLGAIAAVSLTCAVLVTVWLPDARHHGTASSPGGAPGRFRRVLLDRELLGVLLVAGALMGAFVAIYNAIGLRLTTTPYDLSVFQASLVFCAYPIGSVASALAGRAAESMGRPAVVLTGCVVAAGGIALTALAPLPLVALGVVVLTIGFFTAHGVASGWATTLGQARHGAASQASVLYLLSYYVGASVFGALGATIWSSERWPGVVVMTLALTLLAATAPAALVRRDRRKRARPAA